MLRKDSYTVPDLAKLLGVGHEQARRILRDGKLKGVRLTGKAYTITNAALREFLGEDMYNGLIDDPDAPPVVINLRMTKQDYERMVDEHTAVESGPTEKEES